MNDPERLLERPDSLDARLLSAIDEPPPPDLHARTLASLGASVVAPLALAHSASGGAKLAGAKLAGAKLAGGIPSAIGAGLLAGAVAVMAVGAARHSASGNDGARDNDRDRAHASSGTVTPAAPAATVAPLVAEEPSAAPALAPALADHPQQPSVGTLRSPPPPRVARVPLATEIALLDEARRALDGGDAAGAKAIMDRYAREAPHGQLAREAAMLRAEIARAGAVKNP